MATFAESPFAIRDVLAQVSAIRRPRNARSTAPRVWDLHRRERIRTPELRPCLASAIVRLLLVGPSRSIPSPTVSIQIRSRGRPPNPTCGSSHGRPKPTGEEIHLSSAVLHV